jgi:UDP-N-acetylmuramyl pentapeptide synthase
VRYRLRDIPAILKSPLGPAILAGGLRTLAWPLFRPSAWLYRRTVVRKARVVAVTGSFGKTTTSQAIAAVLGAPAPDARNHKTGIAVCLFRYADSSRTCVLEVGIDGPGQMRGFARMIRPDVAVLSGIGSEHGRSLGTVERTLEEKSELVRALRSHGLAILNADDPLAVSAASRTRARVSLCGFSPEADVRVESYRIAWPKGNELRVSVHGRPIAFNTRLLGRQMVFPALAALAVAHEEGVPLELAAERLAALKPVSGRMELAQMANGAICINDSFKGSFESFAAALETVAEAPASRRLLIVGDITEPPGKQSEAYRRLGRKLAEVQDAQIIHIGREAQSLRAGAKKAGFPADRILELGEEVLPAIERIHQLVEPGDTVLLKGRDSQKLERILLALQDVDVRCGIKYCDKRVDGCTGCPLLERGWDGLPEFMDGRSRARRRSHAAASPANRIL